MLFAGASLMPPEVYRYEDCFQLVVFVIRQICSSYCAGAGVGCS